MNNAVPQFPSVAVSFVVILMDSFVTRVHHWRDMSCGSIDKTSILTA